MAQKVKPLKIEDTTSGGDLDMIPHEADPTEDYLAAKGVAFENKDTTLIDTDGSDNIQFTDPIVGVKTVNQVQSTARVTSNDTTPNYLFSKIVAGDGITLAELNDAANETLEVRADAGFFGSAFAYDEDDTESSTTSLTYVEKLTLPTGTTIASEYFIFWFYEAKNPTGNSKEMGVRVQVDNTATVNEVVIRDSKNEWGSHSGFDIYTFTAATHTIDIDFKDITDTAFIRRARLAIWRAG